MDTNNEEYLAHYGIKGQKWGIRRYQNSDGTLTSEGKARARKEYKQDNKEAFEKGREATVLNRAAGYSQKVLDKSIKRYQKNMTDKNSKRVEDAIKVNSFLQKEAKRSLSEVKAHHDDLIKKYGKNAVSDIHYNKKGNITERTTTNAEIAAIIAMAIGSPETAGAYAVLQFPAMKAIQAYSDVATRVAKERFDRS